MGATELADSFEGIKTHWSFWGRQQEIIATLRSQDTRIKELEAENAELTERIRAYLAPLEMPPLNCKRQVRDDTNEGERPAQETPRPDQGD